MSIYHDAVDHFGEATQVLKAAEAHARYAAELSRRAVSMMRGEKPGNGNALATERAECEISEKIMDIILRDLGGAKTEWKRRKIMNLSAIITNNKQQELSA